jgi:hypothetical protein
MEREQAAGDLRHLDDVLRRARARVDPHAFHFVHWGWIVLVWYPLANVFELMGRPWWQLPLGVGAFALGMTLSAVRERGLATSPRVPAEDPTLGRQLAQIVAVSLAATFVLSGLAPATGFIEGRNVPILWGLAYANIACMTGVVYRREFLWAGIVIFAGAGVAMILAPWNGLVLGPVMGLGMILPGRLAEKSMARVAGTEDELPVEGV